MAEHRSGSSKQLIHKASRLTIAWITDLHYRFTYLTRHLIEFSRIMNPAQTAASIRVSTTDTRLQASVSPFEIALTDFEKLRKAKPQRSQAAALTFAKAGHKVIEKSKALESSFPGHKDTFDGISRYVLEM